MNFFGAQEKAKRDSWLLIAAFAAAVAFNALIVNSFAKWITKGSILSWSVVAIIWFVVLIACWKRWRDVRSGGHLLAATYGGMYISEHTQDRQDRKLLNVAAEMAIASSQEKPTCFCLRDETNINAFLIGTNDDTVLVVTQGAIDKLERDELQAIIGHEFGHISNNDLTINMRLLVALGGLNAINRFGLEQFEMAKALKKRLFVDRNATKEDNVIGLGLYWVFGALFCFLGYPLVFSGDVIKTAFSRKREYLADAKAIQYTREPRSLASALHKATRGSTTAALHTCYASELDHLCFFGPWKHPLFSGLLASHPSPQSRIELIDPGFVAEQNRKSRRSYESVSASASGFTSTFETVQMHLHTDPGLSAMPIQQLSEELAIVLSLAVSTCGYDQIKTESYHQQLLKVYTDEAHPVLETTEPEFAEKLDKALDELLQQPPAQRKALLEHIQDIVEDDNFVLPEEKKMYEYLCERLNPPAKAA